MIPNSIARHLRPLVLLSVLSPLSLTLAAPAFTITTFNVSGGFDYEASYSYGLNAQGDVVGSGGNDTTGYAPFVYSNGVVTTLPSTGFFDGANAINDTGEIVGSIDFTPSRYDAGTNTWIRLTSDDSATDVYALNNSGVAVGQFYNDDAGAHQALRYNTDGSITKLQTLVINDTGGSCAVGINSTGAMVGCADTESGVSHAVSWDSNGNIQDLGSLVGANGYSEGYGINDLGQIVGVSENASGDIRGFIWTANTFQELGIVAGGGFEYSEAYGINNVGHAVGRIASYGGDVNSAFYYDGVTMWDLAALVQGGLAAANIDYFYNATAINGNGQILADAFDLEGNRVAVLLTPSSVPEPGTWGAIIGLGLGIIVLQRHRRRRA